MTLSYEAILFDMAGTLFDLAGCGRETVRRLWAQTDPALDVAATVSFLDVHADLGPIHWAGGLAAGATRETIVHDIFAATVAHLDMASTALHDQVYLYWQIFAHGLLHYFETIVVSEEVGVAKPDQRFFAHALADLAIEPGAALYVGDSMSHDLAGADKADVDFCL